MAVNIQEYSQATHGHVCGSSAGEEELGTSGTSRETETETGDRCAKYSYTSGMVPESGNIPRWTHWWTLDFQGNIVRSTPIFHPYATIASLKTL